MILEEALLKYFRLNAELVALVGSKEQIDIGQIAPTEKMPWIAIEVSPGTRTKIAHAKMEQRSTIRITVNGGPQHKVKCKSIAEKALRLLENYRGGLYDIDDVYITCNAINGISGLGNSVRYQFLANIRFTETLTKPSVVTS